MNYIRQTEPSRSAGKQKDVTERNLRELTPWNISLLEKLIVLHMVERFSRLLV
jgi:hypothetical protein